MRIGDHGTILNMLGSFGVAIDMRDWDLLASLFASPTRYDYSDAGVEAADLTPSEIVRVSRRTFEGFDATQHLIANRVVRLQGEGATASAHVRTMHVLENDDGSPLYETAGYYWARLARQDDAWKFDTWTFKALWASGNSNLFALSRERLGA